MLTHMTSLIHLIVAFVPHTKTRMHINFEQKGSCMFCFFCRNTAIVKTEVAVADMNYSDVTAVLTAADLARFRAAFVQPS